MQAIILAGGLGTRLRSVVDHLPKCLAPVAGHPFLYYVITNLERQGIHRIILSVGYLMEPIITYIEQNFSHLDIKFVIETTPLGTGGGIYLACENADTPHVFVLNGDSFFNIDFGAFYEFHKTKKAESSLALKRLQHFDRYGRVIIDEKNRITQFIEKDKCEDGIINGGVYILDRKKFLSRSFPEKFSIENDYFKMFVDDGTFFGMPFDGFFIDIGIPEDFYQSQELFKSIFN
jgi:D-glycero-alpha-D-manno-heptose 1-phosphate guanylyltransferase